MNLAIKLITTVGCAKAWRMNSQSDNPSAPLWSVLISSFDDNCDLWPLFFHFFFKRWPDVPTPVYLVTNFRSYEDPRVVSLRIGPDMSWGETISRSLCQIPSKHVWMLLDDFFLTSSLETDGINRIVSTWDELGGRYLETGRRGDVGNEVPGTNFRHIPATNPLAGINSAFYERSFLADLAQPGMSVWQGNSRLRELNLADHPDIYYLRKEAPPMIQFVEAVKGKFWKPSAIEFLRENGIQPNLNWRPCPPQGQGIFPKLVRSFHKRHMKWRKRHDERCFSAGAVPPPVCPLPH